MVKRNRIINFLSEIQVEFSEFCYRSYSSFVMCQELSTESSSTNPVIELLLPAVAFQLFANLGLPFGVIWSGLWMGGQGNGGLPHTAHGEVLLWE